MPTRPGHCQTNHGHLTSIKSDLASISKQSQQTEHGVWARVQQFTLVHTARGTQCFMQEEHCSPASSTREWGYPPSRKPVASLSAAPTTTNAAAQTELWWEHHPPRRQASGCALLWHQDRMAALSTPVRCIQGEEPFRLRAPGGGKLVEKYQGVWETETDYWNHTLCSLGQAQWAGCTTQDSQHRIPHPLSAWLNTVTQGTGGNSNKFLPGAAGVFSL